jgi:predicted nucleic-acid-binding protein
LRSVYKKPQADILKFFTALLEIDDTAVEDSGVVVQALAWYALGADFANALHLAACGSAVMHTFDKRFCKAARDQQFSL